MKIRKVIIAFFTATLMLTGCAGNERPIQEEDQQIIYVNEEAAETELDGQLEADAGEFNLNDIPEFDSNPYAVVNDNKPFFTDEELTTDVFEHYSDLDALGRCGTAYANICKELMPTEKRQEIGQIKPSGWHTIKYDNVDGKYLYNRCHLIGFQLAGENANNKNLITGTRYMNVDGMLPFENLVADFVQETNYHVLYRVTPIYASDQDLVAKGVLMEAKSVEDSGRGVEFCVFCYNNQPDIEIDYSNGDSQKVEEDAASTTSDQNLESYVLNTKTMKFHKPSCDSAKEISDANRREVVGDREKILEQGYTACKKCNP